MISLKPLYGADAGCAAICRISAIGAVEDGDERRTKPAVALFRSAAVRHWLTCHFSESLAMGTSEPMRLWRPAPRSSNGALPPHLLPESYARVPPIRDAATNAKIKTVVKALGVEAPAVAAFFVSHNGSRYVGAMHQISFLATDYAKLRTEWATDT